jgi:GDPmannose 4,6-dehydratase
VYLGNLGARRDWGHARDYVEAQWLMLQQDQPQDYVIATGEQRSVRDFVNATAGHMGIKLEWRGEGSAEHAVLVDQGNSNFQLERGDVLVRIDPRYYRPAEVETLLGDASKAARDLGWKPRTSFDELVREMVVSDLAQAQEEALVKQHRCKV